MLQSLDALLVTDPTNIYYLTGFMGLAPDEREAYVLVTQDKLYLFTNPLYREQAEKIVSSSSRGARSGFARQSTVHRKKTEYVEISRENPLAQQINAICHAELTKRHPDPETSSGLSGSDGGRNLRRNNNFRLGFEEDNLTVAELHALEKELNGINFVPTQNRVEELRKFKRPDEIAQIKSACKLTDNCFDFILTKLIPGVIESEIAWEIESYFKKRGAENAFPPIVAFGKNSSQPHYTSTNCLAKSCGAGSRFARPDLAPQDHLRTADLILLDFGARVNGYCADMTRMIFMGLPKTEWKKAYEALKLAQQKALDLLVSGQRSGAKLDQVTRDELARHNFPPYPHSLGHAVGLAIHEGPRLSIKHDEELQPGMVFSIEPGIYVPGEFGIRIEDLVLLKSDGIEVLSQSQKNLTVL